MKLIFKFVGCGFQIRSNDKLLASVALTDSGLTLFEFERIDKTDLKEIKKFFNQILVVGRH